MLWVNDAKLWEFLLLLAFRLCVRDDSFVFEVEHIPGHRNGYRTTLN